MISMGIPFNVSMGSQKFDVVIFHCVALLKSRKKSVITHFLTTPIIDRLWPRMMALNGLRELKRFYSKSGTVRPWMTLYFQPSH